MVAVRLQLQFAVAEGLGKVSVQPVISSVADGHNFGGLLEVLQCLWEQSLVVIKLGDGEEQHAIDGAEGAVAAPARSERRRRVQHIRDKTCRELQDYLRIRAR